MAWSADFGGVPFDPRVPAALAPARGALEAMGCAVEDADPDLSGAAEAFDRWRAWYFELNWGPLLDRHRDEMKDTVIWNIEQGRGLSASALAEASRRWTALLRRVRAFFERYEFFVLPVSQVPPFDVTVPYPTEVAGVPMKTYTEWMASCAWVSLFGAPAISVPVGATPEGLPVGLPVGLQIVGRPRDDFGVLQLAHALEREPRVVAVAASARLRHPSGSKSSGRTGA